MVTMMKAKNCTRTPQESEITKLNSITPMSEKDLSGLVTQFLRYRKPFSTSWSPFKAATGML
jgi:hypothetical protein